MIAARYYSALETYRALRRIGMSHDHAWLIASVDLF